MDKELSDIDKMLWIETPPLNAAQRSELLDLYKICHEGASAISERRGTMNKFFLTFHTAVLGLLATFMEKIPDTGMQFLLVLLAVIACFSWIGLLSHYRRLNTAKYKVIGLIERKLVASPFWGAEWGALEYGKNPARYVSLALQESVLPWAFALVYVILATRLISAS